MNARTLMIAGYLWCALPAALAQVPATTQSAPAAAGKLLYVQTLSPDAIRLVQSKLHDAGAFAGAADGNWGNDSAQALQAYQQDHGLQTTGQVNEATAMMLGLDLATLLAGQPSPAAASASAAPAAPAPASTQAAPAPAASDQTAAAPAPGPASAAPAPAQSDQTAAASPPAGPPHAPQPLSTDDVRALQARLREAGFYRGAIDGVWGASSQNALLQLQQARGLPVTGRIDAASVQALGFDPNHFPNP